MYLSVLIFFVFYSGFKVQGQFSTLDVTGSGDGLNENSTYSRLPLIDDNGDISTVVTGMDVTRYAEDNFTDASVLSSDTVMEETTVKVSTEDTFTDSTVTQNSKTSILTSDSPSTELRITETDADSTTTSTFTTISTTETTTFADTTTPEDSSSTETTVTSTTVKTTKKPIKTDTATEIIEEEYRTKPKDTAAKIPPTSAPASTIPMSEDSGKRCLFMDNGLKCDVEVICYGEGEIDCTDDEEMDLDETDYVDEMPSSYQDADYIVEGKTSESYPIRRIDSNSQKIDLFKMFPLTPTNNDVSSEKAEEMTTTSVPSLNVTMPVTEGLFDGENAEINDTVNADDAVNVQDSEVIEELSSFPPLDEPTEYLKIFDDEKLPSIVDNSSSIEDLMKDFEDIDMGADKILITNFSNASEMEISSAINETITYQGLAVNNETLTEALVPSVNITTPATVTSEHNIDGNNKDQPEITRIKRDNNANNSNGFYIPSISQAEMKASPLESSKKKLKVKSCKLSGNLVCIPRPTKSSCSGKVLCQVPPQAIETVEKPATQKGFEKWTVAVIIICAITAFFTIALLIYLVFTSYKKLKVQPQNGVTTLNYVNSAQP